jgi:uncharacterized protein YbaP (TraB family)
MKKNILAAALAAVAWPSFAFAAQPAKAPAPSAAASAKPDADPAMWVVKDADTTIYMFGTFHGLDGKTEWFNDEVKTAFDASEEVIVEAILPEDQAAMQPLIVKYAVDASGKTLSSKLPPATKAKYDKAMASLGVPAQAFEPLEPWFVTIALGAMAGQKIGLKPEYGADAAVIKAAKAAGKKLGELEGSEFQLSMFDKVPEDKQIAQLDQTLGSVDQFGPMMTQMLANWSKGDVDALAKQMNAGVEEMPEMYKMIFTDRNATWADWIGKRMEQPGTVFMAVGAGHLAGKDSVQDLLAKKGIKSEKVKAAKVAAASR